MTEKEFEKYRGKNVLIDGVTLPIVGYETYEGGSLIAGVSNEIHEKETHSASILTAWMQLSPDEVIEKECDYYSYALVDKVIKD